MKAIYRISIYSSWNRTNCEIYRKLIFNANLLQYGYNCKDKQSEITKNTMTCVTMIIMCRQYKHCYIHKGVYMCYMFIKITSLRTSACAKILYDSTVKGKALVLPLILLLLPLTNECVWECGKGSHLQDQNRSENTSSIIAYMGISENKWLNIDVWSVSVTILYCQAAILPSAYIHSNWNIIT